MLGEYTWFCFVCSITSTFPLISIDLLCELSYTTKYLSYIQTLLGAWLHTLQAYFFFFKTRTLCKSIMYFSIKKQLVYHWQTHFGLFITLVVQNRMRMSLVVAELVSYYVHLPFVTWVFPLQF